MTTVLRRAIAPVPHADGSRRWYSFAQPERTLIAWDITQVRDVVAAAERAAAEGRWAVGYVSYDAGPAFDPAIVARTDDQGIPLAVFGVFATAEADPLDTGAPEGDAEPGWFASTDWEPTMTQADYEAGVRSVKESIARGDTYQVNLTQRLRGRVEGDPLALFRSMERSQQGDHAVYLDLGTHAICSASPELFFRSTAPVAGTRRLLSKPMKGTASRSANPRTDARRVERLRASDKDRAENTMIVDMMRNDFGRIARVGSVEVPELHVIETYPTVHQMISTVTAETDASLVEVFDACFPPASITGAPKVKTCEIISELERDARGVYCGAIGVIAPDGMAEFNVAIRTVTVDLTTREASYGVGGGIVWDSNPTSEWFETRAKTQVLESAPGPFDLFETMLYRPGEGITLLARHRARLSNSAKRFGFAIDEGSIDTRLHPFGQTHGPEDPQRLRLVVRPDGSTELSAAPFLADDLATSWPAAVASTPVASDDLFLRHKTTRRGVYERAAADHPDARDVILHNERGELTETTIGNLVLELDGRLVTPPVRCGLLPGTFRAELLAHDKISEAVLTLDDLDRATRVMMINSVRGWVPLLVGQ